MHDDFSAEYSARSDDELLELACHRSSLTNEAAVALDAELNRRKLTHIDEAEHGRFVKRNERRESRGRRRKIFGTYWDRRPFAEVVLTLLVIVLICAAYIALPSRYHLEADREEIAFNVMVCSILIAGLSRPLWRKSTFWVSLLISSAIHFAIVRAWRQRVGVFRGGDSKAAACLGLVLFFLVYGLIWKLRRSIYGEEARPDT